MTATALARTPPAAGASSEFPHVLDGVVLDGAAARLAGMLDRALLEEAGWDPATRILFLPAQHRLLGRQVCRAERCTGTVHNDCPGVCYRCFTRLQRLGMSATGIAAAGRSARSARARRGLRGAWMPVQADGAAGGDVRTARRAVPQPADADSPGAVPHRPVGTAPAATSGVPGAGVHARGRRRRRLLQYPLPAVARGPAGQRRGG